MPNPTWPTNFPAPSADFSTDTEASSVRTRMESGRYRQRRRYTQDLVLVDIAWDLTDTEYGIFQAFVQHTLEQGTQWFDISIPVSGQGMQTHTVRFLEGKYKASYVPVSHWKVSARVEVQQPHRFDTSTLDIFVSLGATESQLNLLLVTTNNLHVALHSTLPSTFN